MIDKIIIATSKKALLEVLSEKFRNINKVEIISSPEEDFYKLPNLDIIHYYGIARESLEIDPKWNESEILETKNKSGFPSFIVVSPIFRKSEFSELEMLKRQFLTPLEKAIEFSTTKSKIKCYGLHTNILTKDINTILRNVENYKEWLSELFSK